MSKFMGYYMSFFCCVFFEAEDQVVERQPQKSAAEWADQLSVINLTILIIICTVMRLTTIYVCQIRCPFFLMRLKAALSGVPKRRESKQTKSKLN